MSPFSWGFGRVPSRDGMAEPEAGMLTEHTQHDPLEGRTPASMRACAIHAPHARKNVARESRLTLTTHAMCMPHDEIAHEGSQWSSLTALVAIDTCACCVCSLRRHGLLCGVAEERGGRPGPTKKLAKKDCSLRPSRQSCVNSVTLT